MPKENTSLREDDTLANTNFRFVANAFASSLEKPLVKGGSLCTLSIRRSLGLALKYLYLKGV
ncbi:MAG: hypothetical protein FWD31_07735 [Planctomycetaceae bacterium]|nr:hypothetical protein [Planctomycetaceae bacterium]